jgi:hypothetical protein
VKIAAYLFEKTVKVVLIGIVLAGVGAAIASGAGALGTGAAAAGEALPTLFAMALVLAMPTRAGEAGAWALSDALRAWFEKGAGLGWPVHLPGQGQALMTDLRVGTVVNAAGDVQVDPAVGAAFLRQMRSLAARLEDDQTPIVVDLVFSDAQFKALDLDEARWAVAFRERLAEAGIPAHVAKRIKFGLVGESRVNARLAELADMEISVIAPPSAVEFWKGFGVPVAILAVVLQGLANVETEVIFTGAAADAVEKLTGLQPKNGEIRLEKMSTPLESIAEEGRKLLLFNKNA